MFCSQARWFRDCPHVSCLRLACFALLLACFACFVAGLFCAKAPWFRDFPPVYCLRLACSWPASDLLWFACFWLMFVHRRGVLCASRLLPACFWLALGLLCLQCARPPVGRFLHRRGGFCTSGLVCLACCWPALSGICCLGLACCARAVARNSFVFDRTARGVSMFPDKSSAPKPVCGQLPM